MSIYEFAKQIFEGSPVWFDAYSVEDAAYDLDNLQSDGWELPEGITAENFAAAMNEILETV